MITDDERSRLAPILERIMVSIKACDCAPDAHGRCACALKIEAELLAWLHAAEDLKLAIRERCAERDAARKVVETVRRAVWDFDRSAP